MFMFFKYFKLIVIFALYYTTSATSWNTNDEYRSKYDVPTKSEIQIYLRVLQNITNFYLENTNKISISVAFGLFIGNVHLGYAMRDFKMAAFSIQNDIWDIYKKSEEILTYYRWNIANGKSATDCLKISKLFTNVSVWIDRVEQFKRPQEEHRVSRDLEKVYRSWRQYAHAANVRYAHHWTPSPSQSDNCLKSLAADHRDANFHTCDIDPGCYQILKYGSDVGYALCHRALILLMARNSRACSIFSPREDRELLDRFCSMGYAEAKYIAYHNYGLVDLLLEYISICALDGRTEFLRRSWLSGILQFQTRHGCFSQDIPESTEPRRVQANEINNDLLGGQCSGHTTALATSALTAAVRYILEQYY